MNEYIVEEKSMWDKVLDVAVFLAVFMITIMLILDITGNGGILVYDPDGSIDSNILFLIVSFIVLFVFLLDLMRLWFESSDVKDFFHSNWLDIFATIPFELIAIFVLAASPTTIAAVGLLKWVRIARLGRVSVISKEFKAAGHVKKDGETYKRKHRL